MLRALPFPSSASVAASCRRPSASGSRSPYSASTGAVNCGGTRSARQALSFPP